MDFQGEPKFIPVAATEPSDSAKNESAENEPSSLSILAKVESQAELEEIEQELIDFGANNDNPIKIWQPGTKMERLPDVSSVLMNSRINESEKDCLRGLHEAIGVFLHSPVFTDSFNLDHGARRIWERETILLSDNDQLVQYYQTNRLCKNNWMRFRNLNDFLQDNKQNLPADLVGRVERIVIGADMTIPPGEEYDFLSDDKKIALMPKIDTVSRLLFRIISEEIKN